MEYPNSETALDYYIDQLAAYRRGERRGIVKDEAAQIEVLLRMARGAMLGSTATPQEATDHGKL